MYKYVAGKLNLGKGLTPYIVMWIENARITHQEVIDDFRLTRVEHAGYVDISDDGFFMFHGGSSSTNFDSNGIDNALLNKSIKEQGFYLGDLPNLSDIYFCNQDLWDNVSKKDSYYDDDECYDFKELIENFKLTLTS